MDCFYIEWTDSSSYTGGHWADKTAVAELDPMKIKTVGWVINETDQFITVVNQVSPHQYAGDICIPKFAITKMKRVKGGDAHART